MHRKVKAFAESHTQQLNIRGGNHLQAVWFQSPRHSLWFLPHSPGPRPAGPQAGFWSTYCLKSKKTSLEGHLPEKGHCNFPAEAGSEARLPKAQPPALGLLFCIGSVSLCLDSQQLPSQITLQHIREIQGWGPKKEQKFPLQGKKTGESGGASQIPTWWSGGIISGVGFLEKWAYHSPALRPCSHRTVARSVNNC